VVVDDANLDLLGVQVTAWCSRDVEWLDTLLESRANATTHLLFVEVLLWSVHVLVTGAAKPTSTILGSAAGRDLARAHRWVILQL